MMVALVARLGLPRTSAMAVLGLAPLHVHPAIARTLSEFHVTLGMSDDTGLVVARIESSCPDLLLIDTDLLGYPGDLCRFARSLRPDVKVLALVCYWSDREDDVRGCADAILHKPPRQPEWEAILMRFGVLRTSKKVQISQET